MEFKQETIYLRKSRRYQFYITTNLGLAPTH